MADTTTDPTAQHDDRLDQPVREYLAKRLPPERRIEILQTGGYDAGLLADVAAQGWFSLAVPEEFGGLGFGLTDLGPVVTALGEHLVPGPVLENLVLPPLLLPLVHGRAAELLADSIETGTPPAFVDPHGSPGWAGRLGAMTLDGDRLRGEVPLVRFGRQAALLVVVADSPVGPVVCLVETAANGVTVEPVESQDPCSSLARVTLDGVVPAVVLDHRDDAGVLLPDALRSWLRLFSALELAGIARRALTTSVAYVGQRVQFDRPVGGFQSVKHIAADMCQLTHSLENLCEASLADLRVGAEDVVRVGACAKAWASEVARSVCEDAVQLHGGIGFTYELELHWYYKHALALRAWLGDEAELELEIGRQLLGVAPVAVATGGGPVT